MKSILNSPAVGKSPPYERSGNDSMLSNYTKQGIAKIVPGSYQAYDTSEMNTQIGIP